MKILKSIKKGFTLVELMVVVAIIGILSAVAIPNFKRYQAKSKASEAKLQLAAIYSSEIAFQADSDWFASCLKDMGYDPSAEMNNRYYGTGFSQDHMFGNISPHTDGKINGVKCTSGGFFFASGKTVGGKTANQPGILNTLASTTVGSGGEIFKAGAAGAVSPDTTFDVWSINEQKKVVHEIIGY